MGWIKTKNHLTQLSL